MEDLGVLFFSFFGCEYLREFESNSKYDPVSRESLIRSDIKSEENVSLPCLLLASQAQTNVGL
jgi:hypothetical protein